jgi:hypothetical protein
MAWANTGITAHIVPVSGGGGVTCYQPIPSGHLPGPGAVTSSKGGAPVDGQPCEMYVQEPVTLDTNGNMIHASYPQPDQGYPGQDLWDSTSQSLGPDQLMPEPNHLVGDGDMAGVHDVLVPFTYFKGTYLHGQCQGGHWMNVEATDPEMVCQLYNPNSALGVCSVTQTHLPANTPPQPGGDVIGLLGQIQTNVNGGTIHSRPNNVGTVQGLVNLETNFWIEGESIAQQQQFLIVAPGPGVGGRAIIYQYLVTISLQSVSWNFADGTVDPSGIAGQPWPGQTENHTYRQISDTGCQQCGPNGSYHVTATLNYGLNVTAIWTIGDGATYTQQMTGLSRNFTAVANPEDLKVGQIEGVPVA